MNVDSFRNWLELKKIHSELFSDLYKRDCFRKISKIKYRRAMNIGRSEILLLNNFKKKFRFQYDDDGNVVRELIPADVTIIFGDGNRNGHIRHYEPTACIGLQK